MNFTVLPDRVSASGGQLGSHGPCGFGLRNASLLWRVRGFAVPSAVCIQRRQVFGVRGGKTSVSSLEITVV